MIRRRARIPTRDRQRIGGLSVSVVIVVSLLAPIRSGTAAVVDSNMGRALVFLHASDSNKISNTCGAKRLFNEHHL
jgi:hypothetical protein